MRLDLFNREGVFNFLRTIRTTYIYVHFVLLANFFSWLGMIEPSFFFCFFFVFFRGVVAPNLFFTPKYLRPLVPESDIVAGWQHKRGGSTGLRDGRVDGLPTYLSEISSGAMGWDGIGYLFSLSLFCFLLIHARYEKKRKETCALSLFVVVCYYRTSSNSVCSSIYFQYLSLHVLSNDRLTGASLKVVGISCFNFSMQQNKNKKK